MNILASAAVTAALLTGPLTQADVTTRELGAPGEAAPPQVAQNEQEVQPVPVDRPSGSGEPIAAFWIILPD